MPRSSLPISRVRTFLLLLFVATLATAQPGRASLLSADFSDEQYTSERKVSYLFEGRNAFIKYNPVSLVFGGLLMLYQKTISVQIGAACPYEISCSTFGKQCIRHYGLLKGIPLTADRLTRCTRLAFIDMVAGVDYSPRRSRIFDHPDDYRRR
jgi:uncharacterized protein